MKLLFFSIVLLLLLSSCKDKDLNNPHIPLVEFISHEDLGCGSTPSSSLNNTDDDITFNWQYSSGILKMDFIFSTHCSASCKDSVIIEQNTVNIFLADTSSITARCICPKQHVVSLKVPGYNELHILFYYNAYASDEYHLLLDRTIYLSQ